jgi:hypothetical protein
MRSITALFALALSGLAAAASLQPAREAAELHREFLEWEVGVWDATITMFTPDGELVFEGEQTDRLGACGAWLITDLAMKPAEGAPPYEGHGVLGFDPEKKRLVGLWADSRTDWLATAEGEVSPDGKQLMLAVDGRHPVTREPIVQEWITTRLGPDRRRLEVFLPLGQDGELVMISRIVYERSR